MDNLKRPPGRLFTNFSDYPDVWKISDDLSVGRIGIRSGPKFPEVIDYSGKYPNEKYVFYCSNTLGTSTKQISK